MTVPLFPVVAVVPFEAVALPQPALPLHEVDLEPETLAVLSVVDPFHDEDEFSSRSISSGDPAVAHFCNELGRSFKRFVDLASTKIGKNHGFFF